MSNFLSERNRFSRAANTVAAMNVLARAGGKTVPVGGSPNQTGTNAMGIPQLGGSPNLGPSISFGGAGNVSNSLNGRPAPLGGGAPLTTSGSFVLSPSNGSFSLGPSVGSPSAPRTRQESGVSASAAASAVALVGLMSPGGRSTSSNVSSAANSPVMRPNQAGLMSPPALTRANTSGRLSRCATPADFQESNTSGPKNVAFFHTLPRNVLAGYFESLENVNSSLSPKSKHGSNDPKRQNAKAFLGGTESDETCADILAAIRHLATLNYFHPALFVRNERFQSLKDTPISESCRGTAFWDEWRDAWEDYVSEFVKDAVNFKVVMEADLQRFVHVGASSVLDMLTGVLIHQWKSAEAAKHFISAWQHTWAAVFEFRVDGVTCPVTAGFNIQGDWVTITCLPPVEATYEPLQVDVANPYADSFPDNASPVQVAARRLCHALALPSPPPLYYGVDGRYYILTLPESAMASFPGMPQKPRAELLRAQRLWPYRNEAVVPIAPPPNSTAAATAAERFSTADEMSQKLLADPFCEEDLDVDASARNDPLRFLKSVVLRRVALDLIIQAAKYDVAGKGTITKDFAVRNRIIPQTCHAHGANICFMYELSQVMKTLVVPPIYEIPELLIETLRTQFMEAMQIEMAARTVKHLAKLDMAFGAGNGLGVTDGARRVNVPNRIAQLLVDGDAHFWDNVLIPQLRSKFNCPATFYISRGTVPMPLLLRQMVMAIGCELDAAGQRFSHFCPCAATKAAVFRPSTMGQLAYEKRWAEVELEVPRMWVTINKLPNGTPLKHSLMLRAALDTILTRASDLCGIAIASLYAALPYYEAGSVPLAEIYQMLVELEIFTSRSGRSADSVSTEMMNAFPCTGKNDPNASIIGAKLLALGMHTKDIFRTLSACQYMHRAPHALTPLFSTTMNIAQNISTGMMKHEASEEKLAYFFEVATAHVTLMGEHHPQFLIKFMLSVTGTVIDSDQAAKVPGAIAFAQDTFKKVRTFAGPESAPTAMAAYHLAIVGLKSKGAALPAIAKHLGLMERAMECVRSTPADKQVALARGPKMIDLLKRVSTTLTAVGDKSSAALLSDHCLAMEKIANGETPNAPLNMSFSWKAGSFRLSGSMGGSLSAPSEARQAALAAAASSSFSAKTFGADVGAMVEEV